MSYTTSVRAEGVPEQMHQLNRLDTYLGDEYRVIMRNNLPRMKNSIKKRLPVFTGASRNSVGVTIKGGGANVRGAVRVMSGKSGAHTNVIEHGRKANSPMPATNGGGGKHGNLTNWVIARLNVPEAQAPRVAFAVARSIARKGYPGRFVFREVRDSYLPRVAAEIQAATNRALQRMEVRK